MLNELNIIYNYELYNFTNLISLTLKFYKTKQNKIYVLIQFTKFKVLYSIKNKS